MSCSAPHDNPLDPGSPNYQEPVEPPTEQPVPTFSINLRSVHTSQWFPTSDIYSVAVELWPDSNIAISSVEVHFGEISRPLGFSNGIWRASLSASTFSDPQLETVVGQPFTFDIESLDTVFHAGPAYVFRVLQETPQLTQPGSNDITSPFPTLIWPAFEALYDFQFEAVVDYEILQGVYQTVWRSDTLQPTSRTVTVSDSLPDGEFYWTLYVYDNFGNSTRSKEGFFVVSAGTTR